MINITITIMENVMGFSIFTCLVVELEGNVYVNVTILELCGVLGNILALIIMMKPEPIKNKLIIMKILGVLMALFVFKKQNDEGFMDSFLLMLVFVIKLLAEGIWGLNLQLVF